MFEPINPYDLSILLDYQQALLNLDYQQGLLSLKIIDSAPTAIDSWSMASARYRCVHGHISPAFHARADEDGDIIRCCIKCPRPDAGPVVQVPLHEEEALDGALLELLFLQEPLEKMQVNYTKVDGEQGHCVYWLHIKSRKKWLDCQVQAGINAKWIALYGNKIVLCWPRLTMQWELVSFRYIPWKLVASSEIPKLLSLGYTVYRPEGQKEFMVETMPWEEALLTAWWQPTPGCQPWLLAYVGVRKTGITLIFERGEEKVVLRQNPPNEMLNMDYLNKKSDLYDIYQAVYYYLSLIASGHRAQGNRITGFLQLEEDATGPRLLMGPGPYLRAERREPELVAVQSAGKGGEVIGHLLRWNKVGYSTNRGAHHCAMCEAPLPVDTLAWVLLTRPMSRGKVCATCMNILLCLGPCRVEP